MRSTSDVVLNDLRVYGPVPADWLLRNDSAWSALSAPGWSVPPCAFTSFELTMPRAGFGMMNGIAGLGSCEVRTTVDASGADTVTPASRNEGLPLMLMRRLKENMTSAEVSCAPSPNLMSLRSLNVKVFASDDAVYELATAGTGVAESAPLKVSRVL